MSEQCTAIAAKNYCDNIINTLDEQKNFLEKILMKWI